MRLTVTWPPVTTPPVGYVFIAAAFKHVSSPAARKTHRCPSCAALPPIATMVSTFAKIVAGMSVRSGGEGGGIGGGREGGVTGGGGDGGGGSGVGMDGGGGCGGGASGGGGEGGGDGGGGEGGGEGGGGEGGGEGGGGEGGGGEGAEMMATCGEPTVGRAAVAGVPPTPSLTPETICQGSIVGPPMGRQIRALGRPRVGGWSRDGAASKKPDRVEVRGARAGDEGGDGVG